LMYNRNKQKIILFSIDVLGIALKINRSKPNSSNLIEELKHLT